ncbi:mitochondrial carrier [Lichtheimia hyalospora FSU 10163]|nr:mitochondrial carrier [Lichtheimia hyalospora FSU 10163]
MNHTQQLTLLPREKQSSPITQEYQTTPTERIISACGGALLTMLLMTPLDVVKTRLQTQEIMGVRHLEGTLDGLYKIARHEGTTALFRGLSAGLLISVPATVNYYAGYDYIRDKIKHSRFRGTALDEYSPLWAGATARAFAASIVSPLELFKTRIQASDKEGIAAIWRGIMYMVRQQGPSTLWRGIVPTLLRDVPFSGVYWMAYDRARKHLTRGTQQLDGLANFQTAFLAGASSGMLAALVTHPFDVVKTQRQVCTDHNARATVLMRQIIYTEGYTGFFKGLVPRLFRVAPSCAIMISSYEVGKHFFAHRRNNNATIPLSSSSS